jgi:hypothetical protein
VRIIIHNPVPLYARLGATSAMKTHPPCNFRIAGAIHGHDVAVTLAGDPDRCLHCRLLNLRDHALRYIAPQRIVQDFIRSMVYLHETRTAPATTRCHKVMRGGSPYCLKNCHGQRVRGI